MDVHDIVLVSELCVILQSVMDRMGQAGAFPSDTMEETDQFDNIT